VPTLNSPKGNTGRKLRGGDGHGLDIGMGQDVGMSGTSGGPLEEGERSARVSRSGSGSLQIVGLSMRDGKEHVQSGVLKEGRCAHPRQKGKHNDDKMKRRTEHLTNWQTQVPQPPNLEIPAVPVQYHPDLAAVQRPGL
jgi:hypothetical protein